jgi:DNA mismatch endonuclease, patch repair protein
VGCRGLDHGLNVAPTTPSYQGLHPASARASRAARGASKKVDTRPEVALRRLLREAGYHYRKDVAHLPGRPDIAFPRQKVAVFCDGDFWHGRNWATRKAKLARGTNAPYWLAKIERNMERDLQHQRKLEARGWLVLRFWESEITTTPHAVASEIISALEGLPDW